MITFPNAKINIGLNITEKRNDGFHNIETIFLPIKLSDILEIIPSKNNISFINSGLKVENGDLKKNLCYKAYSALKKDFDLPPIDLHLHKVIPFGSGLGGGSADASFTLKLLNEIFKLELSSDKLIEYASIIGSDCAIFIDNKPAFAWERGNKLEAIEVNLKGKYIAIVHPNIHVNTGAAYSKSTPKNPSSSLKDLIKLPIEKWKEHIINDFEDIVFPDHPEIKTIKEKLYDQGAIYASMSGSGSAVFGIFNQEIYLKDPFPNYFVWSNLI